MADSSPCRSRPSRRRARFRCAECAQGAVAGANLTLAPPYVQPVFHKEGAWAAQYGLNETIVRIPVGLEDAEALLESFEVAVRKADGTTQRRDGGERIMEGATSC